MINNNTKPQTGLARRAASRTGIIILEWIAGVVGLLLVACGLLMGRLATGPLTIDALTPYLEQALDDEQRGLTTHIEAARLVWDRSRRQIALQFDGLAVSNKAGEAVIAVPDANIRLDALALLIGQLRFKEIRVNGVNARLERTEDGQLAFYGVPPVATVETSAEYPLSAIFGAWPARLQAMNEWLRRLEAVSLTSAEVSLTDHKTGKVQQVSLPDLALANKDGRLTGAAALELALEPAPLKVMMEVDLSPSSGQGHVAFSWEKLDLSALAGLDSSLAGMAGIKLPLTGKFAVIYETADRMTMDLALQADSGMVELPGLLPKPLPVKSANVHFAASATPDDGVVKGKLDNSTVDLDGITATFDADIARLAGRDREMVLNAKLANVPENRLADMWPEKLSPGAREWVTQNLRDGVITDATLSMKTTTPWPNIDGTQITAFGGTMNVGPTTMTYLGELPPIRNTTATVEYDLREMRIKVTDGDMNGVKVLPSDVVINYDNTPETIDIKVHGSGRVTKVLEAIDKKPLEYAKKIGLKPQDMDGDADFNLNLALPLLADLPLDDVKLALTGTIKNFTSDALVSGIKLANGDLKIELGTNDMTINGGITASGAAGTVTWKEIFSPQQGPASDATVKLSMTNSSLGQLGVTGDYVKGTIPVTVRYQRFPKGIDTVDITADLTPAGLNVPEFFYNKSQGASGKLTAKVRMPSNAPIQISALTATAPQLDIAGTASLSRAPTKLQQINLTRARIGENNFSAELARLGGDGWEGVVTGQYINFDGLIEDDAATEPSEPLPPLNIVLDVQKAGFTRDRVVAPLRLTAKRDGHRWQTIDADMQADGVPFQFVLKEKLGGGQTLKVQTPDLGKVLSALDQGDFIIGGRLRVEGESSAADQPVEGRISLDDFRVRNMPFIASLISAISAEGLLNAFSGGEGLQFNRLRGDIALQDDVVRLRGVKTSGGALGLTVEGSIDTGNDKVALQGTAVPFNSVNSILGNVPIIGQVLGGSSGIFAATYTAAGPMDDIKVSVNPLSILAPGFLRDLFFIDSKEQ